MTLNTNDGTLDAFIRSYCYVNRIECDGDVFSQAFSLIETGEKRETFSEGEARAIISNAALAYDLYKPTKTEALRFPGAE